MNAKEIAEYQMIYGSDPPFQKLAKAYLDLLEHNRWIQVSERLPEEAGEYLCFVGGKKMILWYYSGLDKFGRSDMTDFDFKWVTDAITHWKPLPNVPEE